MRVWATFLFLAVLVASQPPRTKCTKPNDCEKGPEVGGPVCLIMPSANRSAPDPASECRMCDPALNPATTNCGCPVGQICRRNPLDESVYGMCARVPWPIGKPCSAAITPLTLRRDGPNANAWLFCGIAAWDGNVLLAVEWMGSCVRNVCRECDYKSFPGCKDDRQCTSEGELVYAAAGENSWAFVVQNMWVLWGSAFFWVILIGGIMSIVKLNSSPGSSRSDAEKKPAKKDSTSEGKKSKPAAKSEPMSETGAAASSAKKDVMQVKEGDTVRATHAYEGEAGDPPQLSFKQGTLIHVSSNPTPTRWILGFIDGQSPDQAAWFSAEFVEVV